MEIKKNVSELRKQLKDEICNLLVNKYKELNNGLLPRWENGEEIIIKNDKKIKVFTYDYLLSYNVTLEYNLFFELECGFVEWIELYTDDLLNIYLSLK